MEYVLVYYKHMEKPRERARTTHTERAISVKKPSIGHNIETFQKSENWTRVHKRAVKTAPHLETTTNQ